ncbi:non-canonical purine NTP pyrophosphatase [Bacteroidia bacterium]|nr:non-canonical purine NTP pyrophosphatase [Bacteroidia bacterium]GHT82059.1 non-canonical purine NTP pyrophosphatase [Bacteroidia bacterium]
MSTMELIFATNNAHKLQEVSAILGNQVQLSTPAQHGINEDIPETQATLAGNALQKVRYIHQRLHKNCFADDTGLEVDYLNGAPGVYSARYAGEQKDMNANKHKLLHELQNAPLRTARFRTVIALVFNDAEYIFEGVVEGKIIENEVGSGGFGYDGLFIPDGFTQTFAQMSATEKNNISHRARAVQKLAQFFNDQQPITNRIYY